MPASVQASGQDFTLLSQTHQQVVGQLALLRPYAMASLHVTGYQCENAMDITGIQTQMRCRAVFWSGHVPKKCATGLYVP